MNTQCDVKDKSTNSNVISRDIRFARGICHETGFIDALNRAYSQGGWWKNMVDDPRTYVAIRDNYLNVYSNGCSIVKLRFQGDKLIGETSYKYLVRYNVANKVEVSTDGEISRHPEAVDTMLVHSLEELDSIIYWTKHLAGDEKIGVHQILCANRNTIDTEIAFTDQAEDDESPSASRIDFAALQRTSNGLEVVFFEAKHFTNPELRSSGDSVKVLEQVDRYEKLLMTYQNAIHKSYVQVCRNILAIDGNLPFKPFAEEALKEGFSINLKPRLVIFGFDGDQKLGDYWKKHNEKLTDKLGKDRVLLKGDSRNFKNGIS
jgi:hypothetical protein